MNLFRRQSNPAEKRVGIFIDAPNIFREARVDLFELGKKASKYGHPSLRKIFFDKNVTEGLVEVAFSAGFETIITAGDVDVLLACQAVEAMLTNSIDTLVLVSGDSDFLPLFLLASKLGKGKIVICPEDRLSSALKNLADKVELL